MLKLVHDATAVVADDPQDLAVGLDELCRLAAQDMLKVALLAERRAYLDAHVDCLDATGKRLMVGNGYARPAASSPAPERWRSEPLGSRIGVRASATGR